MSKAFLEVTHRQRQPGSCSRLASHHLATDGDRRPVLGVAANNISNVSCGECMRVSEGTRTRGFASAHGHAASIVRHTAGARLEAVHGELAREDGPGATGRASAGIRSVDMQTAAPSCRRAALSCRAAFGRVVVGKSGVDSAGECALLELVGAPLPQQPCCSRAEVDRGVAWDGRDVRSRGRSDLRWQRQGLSSRRLDR